MRYPLKANVSLLMPTRHCIARICFFGYLLHILIEIRFFSRPFPLKKNRCKLANFGFATVFGAPKLARLQHLGHTAGKGQHYCSPKNGLSEVNYHLTTTSGCQCVAMVWRNCCLLRSHLKKHITAGSGYSD